MSEDASVRDALRDLLQSPGWQMFVEACQQQYGDSACIAHIDEALSQDRLRPGDHEAIQDTVQQIRASSRAVLSMIEWPAQQLAALEPNKDRRVLFRRRVNA